MGSKKPTFSHLAKAQLHQTPYLKFTILFFNIFLLFYFFHNFQIPSFSHSIPLPRCFCKIFPLPLFFCPTTHVPPPFLFSFSLHPPPSYPSFSFFFPFQFVPLYHYVFVLDLFGVVVVVVSVILGAGDRKQEREKSIN